MPELNSISDIDNMLDAQYAQLGTESGEETVEDSTSGLTEETPTTTPEPTEEPESTETAESVEIPEVKAEKPTKDEKQQYSFKALREERDNYKSQSEQYAKDSEFLKQLANYYGYSDTEDFKKQLRIAELNKEAQNKGVDPEMYRTISEQNDRIKALEQEKNNEIMNRKAENFNRTVNEVVSELGLGDNGAEIVFQKLAENGFTEIDQVLNLPNVKPLLRGLLSDYVQANAEQKQIEAMKKVDSLSDEPAPSGSVQTGTTLDDIIAKEMKQYKEDNFL